MSLVNQFYASVINCLWAVSNGEDVQTQLDLLAPMREQLAEEHSSLTTQIYSLQSNPTLQKARLTKSMKAEKRRNEQAFQLSWAGGGSERVMGWFTLAKRLQYRETTIRAKLSIGKESFSMKLDNPLTGQPDILTVTRLPLADMGATRLKRGRPPKKTRKVEFM